MRKRILTAGLTLALLGAIPAAAEEDNPFSSAKVKVGSELKIGTWEQDNDTETAASEEDLVWIVLKKDGDRALVITKYVIDGQAFYDWQSGMRPYPDQLTWENSDIRQWLNGDAFYGQAFSDSEKRRIETANVRTDKNSFYKTGSTGGEETQDRIFLLSEEEAKDYFSSKADRQAQPTAYASNESKGKESEEETEEETEAPVSVQDPGQVPGGMASAHPEVFVSEYSDCSFWWLRSPGKPTEKDKDEKDKSKKEKEYTQNSMMCVGAEGSIVVAGYPGARSDIGVRPAMWIALDQ